MPKIADIDISKFPARGLIKLTATHVHHGSTACTAGHHDPSYADYGTEISCTYFGEIVSPDGTKHPGFCICEHHVGVNLPVARLVLEKED